MPNVAPPEWVVKKVEEIYPLARIGYEGKEEYAVLELWRVREESAIGVPFFGHVYGRCYDPLRYVPRHIISTRIEDVFSGRVIEQIKRMLTSFKDRQLSALRAAGEQEDAELTEAAEQMGSELYFRSKQTGAATAPTIPRKMLTPQDKAILSGEAAAEKSEAIKTGNIPAVEKRPLK